MPLRLPPPVHPHPDSGPQWPCQPYDKADEKGIQIIIEPYNGNWTYIGVPFLNKDIDKTIENLKTVKEKFEEAFKELMDTIPESEVSLRETLNKEIPQIIEESYYS